MDLKGIRSDKLDLCKKCGKMFLKTKTNKVCPYCIRQKKWSFKYDRCIKCGRKDFQHIAEGLCFICYRKETGGKVAIGEKEQKWSQKHERCVKCGRNDVKHLARGLCLYCYQQETEKRSRGDQPQKYGLASEKLNYEYLYEQYFSNKRSLSDIAKDCNCSRQFVYKKMMEFNVPLRKQSDARTEAIKKGKFERFEYHEINEKFFSEWSPEMAWVLGLLFTDGTIDKTRVAINSVDIDLLEKIRSLLKSSNPIQKRVQSYDKSKHIYEFVFYREKMRDDLLKLGLIERKSLVMVFPDVPEEYMRHFIRGCWDGDGSIFFSGGKLRASYVCGSLKFMERLVQELYKKGIHGKKPLKDKLESDKRLLKYPDGKFPFTIHDGKVSKSYNIKIGSKENLEKLFDYFYDGVDESMYLERKFKTFAKGLGIITDGLQEI